MEQLHSVEGANLEQLAPSTSGRHNRETVRLRDTLCRRSSMADALVPILDLWRNAVLVMDEVRLREDDIMGMQARTRSKAPLVHAFARFGVAFARAR